MKLLKQLLIFFIAFIVFLFFWFFLIEGLFKSSPLTLELLKEGLLHSATMAVLMIILNFFFKKFGKEKKQKDLK